MLVLESSFLFTVLRLLTIAIIASVTINMATEMVKKVATTPAIKPPASYGIIVTGADIVGVCSGSLIDVVTEADGFNEEML